MNGSGIEYHIMATKPPGQKDPPYGFKTDPPPTTSGADVFHDAMKVRIKVFCEEQKCSLENELDDDDNRSWHWTVYSFEGQNLIEPVSCVRIVPPPHAPHPNGFKDPDEAPYVKLGRLATLPEHRGHGLAQRVTDLALKMAYQRRAEVHPEWKGLVLAHVQVAAEKFYERIGFTTDEKLGRWEEEGIQHLGMWKQLSADQ